MRDVVLRLMGRDLPYRMLIAPNGLPSGARRKQAPRALVVLNIDLLYFACNSPPLTPRWKRHLSLTERSCEIRQVNRISTDDKEANPWPIDRLRAVVPPSG